MYSSKHMRKVVPRREVVPSTPSGAHTAFVNLS